MHLDRSGSSRSGRAPSGRSRSSHWGPTKGAPWILGAAAIGICLALYFAKDSSAQEPLPKSSNSTANALQSIFDPMRSPPEKTMGLMQRSFLDLIEASQPELQVAFVVDTSESMQETIAGVQETLASTIGNLKQYRGDDKVSIAIVTYRDIGSVQGAVSSPLPRFVKESSAINAAVASLKCDSGAPYFPEAIDLGVHEAITKLDWGTSNLVTKWIILIGDAPPYARDFVDEEETGAKRHFAEEILIDLARKQEIQINCILSDTRQQDRAVYAEVLPETRRFMNALATSTGGLMLDLSYPDIQQALQQASAVPENKRIRVGKITREEIEQIRQSLSAKSGASGSSATGSSVPTRIAIVPHMPLEDLTIQPRHPAVRVATEMRETFQQLPQVELINSVQIDRELRRIRSSSIPKDQWIRALSVRLRADFLIWGTYVEGEGNCRIVSSVYNAQSNSSIVQSDLKSSVKVPASEVVQEAVGAMMQTAAAQTKYPQLSLLAAAYTKPERAARREQFSYASYEQQVRSNLWVGYESLQQATSLTADSAQSTELLQEAIEALQQVEKADPRNPVVGQWLSNAFFSLAQQSRLSHDEAGATQHATTAGNHLKRAYRERTRCRSLEQEKEIEADYLLLVRKDVPAAIAIYEQLANGSQSGTAFGGAVASSLRARWMLAGIWAGDWNVPPSVVNQEKSRQELVQIMARWPESLQADLIRRSLRWNEEKGESEYPFLSLENDDLIVQNDEAP